MTSQILKNFIELKIKKGDVYLPSAIVLLLKNNGKATVKQIARLIYIFENKYSLEQYETIVKNLVAVILSEYSLITVQDDTFILNVWPIKKDEVDELIKLCYQVSKGFFKNLPSQAKSLEIA